MFVGSKSGRFEPSTAAKPSENRGRMPMTPGPILNALSPQLWVRTAESQPSACLPPCIGSRPGSPGLRTGPTFSSHGLCGSGSSRQRPPCCLPPLYFTLPSHFGRSTASTLPSPIGPLPKSSSRALAVAIPLQGKDTAIPLPNPMIPQGTTTKSLGGLASCLRLTNHVLYMAARCRG